MVYVTQIPQRDKYLLLLFLSASAMAVQSILGYRQASLVFESALLTDPESQIRHYKSLAHGDLARYTGHENVRRSAHLLEPKAITAPLPE